MALVPGSRAEEVVASVEQVTGDLGTHSGACIMILDFEGVRGTLQTS